MDHMLSHHEPEGIVTQPITLGLSLDTEHRNPTWGSGHAGREGNFA